MAAYAIRSVADSLADVHGSKLRVCDRRRDDEGGRLSVEVKTSRCSTRPYISKQKAVHCGGL